MPAYGRLPHATSPATTIAAGVIAILVSAAWCLVAFGLLTMALVFDAVADDGPELVEDISAGIAAELGLVGLVILSCAIWSIVAAANLIRRRPWARVATIVTFSIWSTTAGLTLMGAIADESDDVAVASLWLAASVLVVILAAVRTTREHVESARAQPTRPVPTPAAPAATGAGTDRA